MDTCTHVYMYICILLYVSTYEVCLVLLKVVSAVNTAQSKRRHLWTLSSTKKKVHKFYIVTFNCECLFQYRYRITDTNASQHTIYTFTLILDLMQFFDQYHAGQLEVALDVCLPCMHILCLTQRTAYVNLK